MYYNDSDYNAREESNLYIFHYDGQKWKIMLKSERHLDENYVSLMVPHFSKYALGLLTYGDTLVLYQNYPNPMYMGTPYYDSTTISYYLPESKTYDVSINIYTISGSLVKTFEFTEVGPINDSVLWNARNNTDEQVASGVYLCRMEAEVEGETVRADKIIKIAVLRISKPLR